MNHRFTTLFGPSGAGKDDGSFDHCRLCLTGRRTCACWKTTLLLDTSRGVSCPVRDRSIGFVFQDALLFPHLTVQRNLRYGQHHRRGQKRSVEFQRVVDVLEIGDLLKRYPENLSGGEKQRVALGRTLLSGPELLLMDEPMASLDGPLKTRILAYLERAVAEWDIPTLYVTPFSSRGAPCCRLGDHRGKRSRGHGRPT